MERIDTRCCVVGGGPAGLMLGYLLARAGLPVVVLEKHADFLRDFRGDTIHPSTLQVMHELGLAEGLLRLPHRRTAELAVVLGGRRFALADFRGLSVASPFIAMMPQWDFLDFLAGQAARFPAFGLRRRAEATGLIEEAGRVVGVRATTPEGELQVRSALVVGADGRHSAIRQAAGMTVRQIGAPMDVLWFRLEHRPGDPEETFGVVGAGAILVLIERGEHWQCGYVIPKGGFGALRGQGLPAFRERIGELAPFLRDRVGAIADWDSVKLLTVAVDRLERWWRPGLLCIGDAAHAMSPVGGVGVNLAIQDAVATANRLAGPLRRGVPGDAELEAVQRRRAWPMRVTQALQVAVQNRVITPVLGGGTPRPPAGLRLVDALPPLRRLPGRLVGMGVRPEHVASHLRLPAAGD